MLVLNRKRKEVICIGANIQITVLAIQGGRVQLGIEAPQEVPIRRTELESWSASDKDAIHTRDKYEPIA